MVQLIESLSKKEISAFFNIIYKNSIDSLLLLDENGLILNCNAAAERLFYIKENDMINKNYLDIIIPPSKIYILNERQSLLPSEIFETQTEFSLIRKDQTLIWVRARISKINNNNNNNNNLFLLTCRDITKEKEAEFKLRDIKEKNTKFVQFFRDIINKKEVNIDEILDNVDLLPKDYELDNDVLKKFDELKNSVKEREEYELIEEIINKKLKFEKLLSSISSRFIGNFEFDNAIHTTLRDIGELIEISRVFIFFFDKEEQTMNNTHEWCEENIKSHISFYKDFPLDKTPWIKSHILAGKPLVIPDVSKLPQEATKFKNLLISKNIKANLTLPLYIGGKIAGCIGFDDEKNIREWLDEDFSLLQISSQIIGNAFERKNNEEVLKLSEKKYRNLFENSPMSIILMDMEGYIVDTNPANYYIFGYSKKELINLNFKNILHDLISSEFLPAVIDFYEKLINGEIPESREVRTNRKDGSSIWINLQASFIRLKNQTLIQLIAQNIDNIKKAEQKILESKEQYQSILDSIGDALHVLNRDFTVVYINPALKEWLQKFNFDANIIGKDLHSIFPFLSDEVFDEYLTVFKTAKPIISIENTELNNKLIFTETRKIPIISDGKTIQVITIIRDITEKVRIEQELKASEEKYRHLINYSPYIILLMDLNGNLIDCNNTTFKYVKWKKEDLLKKNFKDLNIIPPANFKILKNQLELLLSNGFIESIELQVNHQDVNLKWISLQASLVKVKNKKLIQIVIQDISDKKQAEIKLQESEEKYRNITEQSLMGIVIIQDDLIKYVNGRLAELIGYSGEELINLKPGEFINLVHEEDRLLVSKQAKKKQQGRKDVLNQYKFRIVRKDKKLVWVEVFSKTILFGERYADLGMFVDITEKIEAEQKIKESELKYKSILENIKEGYYEVDLTGKYTFFNNALCEAIGYTREEILGSNFGKFMDKNNITKVFNFFSKVYKTGKEQTGVQFEVIQKNGESLYIEGSVYLKYDSKGEKIGFYGIVRDITEKVKMEKLEIEFREKLEKEVNLRTKELKEVLDKQKLYLDQIIKASNFKTEFLASMSHELRTPLNAIIGFTELLLEGVYGDLNQEQLDFIGDIEESSNHLLDMIIRILDISKIEAGQVNLKIEKIELKMLIDQIFSTIKPLINEKDIQIKYNGISSKQIIKADRIKFKQILYNLLSNAIKFTIEGQVTLTFIDNKDYWEFSVRDTGIGIADEDFDLIFKDFKRVKSPFIEKVPGSGLGLALTRRIVHLHGGDISFKSKLGKGTIFTFTIPKEFKEKDRELSIQEFLSSL
ncbi:MAG: PAS domain S-box protein [Promethearchaeia archaeon]